ncbi:NADPH-dependent FMN reductase [Haematomicrobium sanguinis]|uniref:NADPH-dependent FMN reductase n=1 Tax=Haematomicrobium sanguinis TaxID=479106 RepID=UPI00094993C1|nr:NAD(P)H-dependent oxidoreductase [Haematomicrobium sanguinis]
MSTKILLVIGSVRPVRIGAQLAESIAAELATKDGVEVDVVDLADLALPFLDEPRMPAMGNYQQEHTRQWADRVRGADAVIFLTPQYNGGYPASLKNAIDYLYAEWEGKPAAIISYGGHGGGQSYNQLHSVLSFIGLRLTSSGINIVIPRDAYGPDFHLVNAAQIVAKYAPSIDRLGDEIKVLAEDSQRANRVIPLVVREVEGLAEQVRTALADDDFAALASLSAGDLDWVSADLDDPRIESIQMLGPSAALIQLADATNSLLISVHKSQYQWLIESVFKGAPMVASA